MKLFICRNHFQRAALALILLPGTFGTSFASAQSAAPAATTTQAPAALPVFVRVQLNGKAVAGAHIVILNALGSQAATGDTDATGAWRLKLASGDYTFSGTSGGAKGDAKASVASSLTMVILELAPVGAPAPALVP